MISSHDFNADNQIRECMRKPKHAHIVKLAAWAFALALSRYLSLLSLPFLHTTIFTTLRTARIWYNTRWDSAWFAFQSLRRVLRFVAKIFYTLPYDGFTLSRFHDYRCLGPLLLIYYESRSPANGIEHGDFSNCVCVKLSRSWSDRKALPAMHHAVPAKCSRETWSRAD